MKLNFKYRVLREKTILTQNKNKRKLPYLDGAESEVYKRPSAYHFAKSLLNYDVISFDIFDTLILRPFARPTDLFFILEERFNCIGFRDVRVKAEREAREKSITERGHREVTLDEIYEFVEFYTGIDKNYGAKIEFELETKLCFANPYMKRVFDILIDQGKRIIITSDMYIPHDMMEVLLNKNGYVGYEKLFVSCDYNCNKHQKDLYKFVIDYIGEEKKIIHIGDNYLSDIKSANEMGIDSKYYKGVHDIGTQYRADGMTDLIGSCYSGIINTHLHNGLKQYTSYYEYGFIYGGLYVLGYCNWIYNYCKNNNIDKVLFLARDGYIYQKVFNLLDKSIPNDYVYWSRIANLRCTIDSNRKDFLERVIDGKINKGDISLKDLFISIDLEELCEQFKIYKLDSQDILNEGNSKNIKQLIVDNWDKVVAKYSAYEKNIKLVYERALEGVEKIAIVDVGWLGTNLIGLSETINNRWNIKCEIHGLMAGSNKYNVNLDVCGERNRLNSYLFSKSHNRNLYDFHNNTNRGMNNIFFELLSQAKSPSFIGVDDKFRIKFDIPEVESYESIEQIHKGIYDFAKVYIRTFKDIDIASNISGYDAYCTFRMIAKDIKFFKNEFKDYAIEISAGANKSKQKMEQLGEIIEKRGL